jgi:multicomponent Na+:H+ antiporter subunit F
MMGEPHVLLAAYLLLTLMGGVWRVVRGPTRADRMQTAQLFGTGGAGVLILLGLAFEDTSLFDIALVLALLSAVVVITFTRQVWSSGPGGDPS